MKRKILVFMIALLLMTSLILAVAGVEALDRTVTEKNETIEIHDWSDLDAVRDNLEADYVLMNDLDEDTDGYDELASEEANEEDEFEETLGDFGEEYENGTRFELSYSPVEELLSVEDHEDEIKAEIVDSNDGIIEIIEDVEGRFFVEYTTTEEIALGWGPIKETFVGNFDGNEFEIKDLYIDRRHETRIGLFRDILTAEIKNMNLIDVKVSGEDRVGGIVGLNRGEIYNSSVTGEVNGESWVGGLAAVNGGENAAGVIDNSYSRANVNGEDGVGGIVGVNSMNGWVTNSYATGYVSGEESAVGGIVGSSGGIVKNSYATGDVSGEEDVGGLVGYNWAGTVENSYATGEVTGDEEVGGLVGYNTDTVENSFWDVGTSGQDTSDGGTGKTTAEMKDVATYTDTDTEGLEEPWDFAADPYDDEGDEDIWDIDEEINHGYPFLTWEYEVHSLTINIEGEGSTEPEKGTRTYYEGEEIKLEATPAEGWYFDGWTGDVPEGEEGDEITITMDKDKEITAHFEEYVTLTIEDITGDGNISVDGDVIEAPFERGYEQGEEADLLADPDECWYFEDWEGIEDDDADITITMDEDVTITNALFEEYITLTIEDITGDGTVTVDGDVIEAPFERDYEQGEEVDLLADPDEGWYFEDWEGVEEDDDNITITMDEDLTITNALFEEEEKDDDEIPGFTSTLLLLALVITVAMYQKKKEQ